MTPVTCKKGVVFAGFSPGLARILLGLSRLSDRYCIVITSASDGRHAGDSRHYQCDAIDVRTKHYTEGQRAAFLAALRSELGPAFTVLLEAEGEANEHGHVQPRKGTVYTVEQLRQV